MSELEDGPGKFKENDKLSVSRTGERTSPESFASLDEYAIHLRSLFVYDIVGKRFSGGETILEVGSGEGYGTALLSKHVGKVVGVDRNPETISHASRKYREKNCVFMLSNAVSLPFKDASFDVVIAFQLIEHVGDDLAFLSEVHRVLKRRGEFLLTTPNKALRLKEGMKPWNRFHMREYCLDEFEGILRSRFSDVAISGVRGSAEVEKLEMERIRKTLTLRSMDPLNLRKLLPGSVRLWGGKFLRKSRDKAVESEYLPSTRDYYLTKDNLSQCLDFMAICRK